MKFQKSIAKYPAKGVGDVLFAKIFDDQISFSKNPPRSISDIRKKR